MTKRKEIIKNTLEVEEVVREVLINDMKRHGASGQLAELVSSYVQLIKTISEI